MPAFTQAILFLVTTLFDIFITLILLRFIFQLIRVDFYNPLSQAIVKLTNPALIPLRRIIPSIKGIDTAALVLLFGVCMVKLLLTCLIEYQAFPFVGGLLFWTIGDLISSTLNLFFFAILIQAILSWVAPAPGNPAYAILYQLTYPLLQPARRFVKPISGIDVSPIVVLITLQVFIMLIGSPIRHLGKTWSV